MSVANEPASNLTSKITSLPKSALSAVLSRAKSTPTSANVAMATTSNKSAAMGDTTIHSLEDLIGRSDESSTDDSVEPNLVVAFSKDTLSTDDKKSIAAELQKQSGVQDKKDTLKNFLETLAENNRLGVLHGVCEKFAVLMSAARGEVELTITSAAPLDQKTVRQLEQAVSKSQYVGKDKKLKVVPKVRSQSNAASTPKQRANKHLR